MESLDRRRAVAVFRNLIGVETLVELLAQRVGSPVSFSNLASDLAVTPQTVLRWVEILERLFVVFVIRPYSKNLARSLLKEPKVYFYNTGCVVGDESRRLENAVACALLKRNMFLDDTRGVKADLYYLRDKEKREVDFLTVLNYKPEMMIEVKLSDDSLSPHPRYFAERHDGV